MIDPDGIRQRYAALSSILDERGRRLLVAAEAKAAGYGGIAAVWRATGVAPSTIGRGLRELAEAPALTAGRVRRAGGGRKPAVAADPDLMRDPEGSGRAERARRSRGAAALDLQEPAPACRRASGPGPSDQPHAGGRVAARARLHHALVGDAPLQLENGAVRQERQGLQSDLLLSKGFVHDPFRRGVHTGIRHRVEPMPELGIQVVEMAEGAGEKEVLPDIAEGALNFALRFRAIGSTRAGLEAVVAGQVEQGSVVDHQTL